MGHSKIIERPLISYMQVDTPIGPMTAWATDKGIYKLEFLNAHASYAEFNALHNNTKITEVEGNSPYFDDLLIQLSAYFNGSLKQFTLPLSMQGTSFQIKVWEQLLTIPYATTRSYKQQALAVDNLLAIRAVASANGANPLAIIVPCHRVIGSSGQLTGYGGGLWRKKWLLDHEAKNAGFKRDLFE